MKLTDQHIELKVEVSPGVEVRFVYDGRRMVTFDDANALRHLSVAQGKELLNVIFVWAEAIDHDFSLFVQDVIGQRTRAIPGNQPTT